MAAMLAAQRRAQAGRLMLAAVMGGLVAAAAIALLGLSGWFITGAALAGAAGSGVAHAFNYMMPSAVIRLLAILRTGARYVERVSGHEAALKALAAMRPQLFVALARGAPQRTLALSAGEASARLVEDVDTIQTLFVRLSSPWAFGVGAVVALLLAALATPLASAAVLIGMATAAGGAVRVGRQTAPAARVAQTALGDYKARLNALNSGAAELRAYGLTDWAVDEAARAGRALDRARAETARHGAAVLVWQAAATGLALALSVIAAREAHPALTALAALAAVAGVEAATGLVGALRDNGAAQGAVDRLDALALPDDRPVTAAGPLRPVLEGAFAGGRLSPGQRIGLIGRSGCGKTSLIERLMGLRPSIPDEWRVGGVDVATAPLDRLRALFAYAAQDVKLLDGTIRDNLRLAAPGAADEEMWAALDDAALACRVRLSPAGLDAPVGVNGMRLSGGERRRLALARAFLRPAPWLVLDEPTEGLDATTEARVLERLDQRLSRTGQGLILISHREAPTRLCDLIAVVGAHGPGERPARLEIRPRSPLQAAPPQA
jgi:ATP-binding cassette subfamily C protein CydC